MGVMVKDNKGNINCVGLVNNVAQANNEISNKIETNITPTINIKDYIKALFFTDKKMARIENYQIMKANSETRIMKKIEEIKSENLNQQPRLSVIGSAFEQLKYNVEEEHLVELFSNIIAGEFNMQKSNRVQPSFINIITQLSKEDCLLLKSLKNIKRESISIIEVRLIKNDKNGYISLDKIIVNNTHSQCNHTIQVKDIVLENLERLKLIEIDMHTKLIGEEEICKNGFNYCKRKYTDIPANFELSYTIGILKITNFGLNFINVCCS